MKHFFLFEVKRWLKSPMTWIFLAVYTLLTLAALVSNDVVIGGGSGNTHKNAPEAIQEIFAVLSVMGIIVSTAFFNATATRDYTYGMDQIVFSSPISKAGFFFGKFFGAAVIACIPYLGITLGAAIAQVWPGLDPHLYGPFVLQAHANAFLLFAVFNTLFGGALIYAFAIYFRNPVIAYLSAFGIIVLYVISGVFTADIESERIAILTDPFGIKVLGLYTKYWTPAQKNTGYISLTGIVLLNRLIWSGLAMGVLLLVYRLFDFTKAGIKKQRRASTKEPLQPAPTAVPVMVIANNQRAAWWHQFRFELKSIVRNNAFIILTSIGLINLCVGLFAKTGSYGNRSLPVTYHVVEDAINSMQLFLWGFIIFYTGYSVFRERDARFHEIVDATPARSGLIVTGKIAAITASVGLVYAQVILLGMLSQLIKGYTHLEPMLYVQLFSIELLKSFFLIVLCYLIQTLINNRYVGYFAVVVFLVASSFIWQGLHVESKLVDFGAVPSVSYSDLAGFGPFIPGTLAFGLYWTLASGLLILVATGMAMRGKEVQFRRRLAQLGFYLKRRAVVTVVLLVAFMVCGGWLVYETKVVNTYYTSKERKEQTVHYEQRYKKYEHLPQPFTTEIEYLIDLYASKRDLHVKAIWWVKNVHKTPITDLHFNMPAGVKHVRFDIPGGKLVTEDKETRYNIYRLSQPLQPNDSLQLTFAGDVINDGIENEVSGTEIVQNGSFFHNDEITPIAAYQPDRELQDKNDRRKYKLAPRARMARLTRDCGETCNTTYISNTAAWVRVKTTISTDAGQTAIAPGTLVRQWEQGGRSYFRYELKHEALYFFAFVSADYAVKRDSVNGVAVEVYYSRKHPYNVDRMVNAVKRSLAYYTTHFGPYYQEQCRIIEYPRYGSCAQAFPGTMPYSEAIGYILDLRDPKSVDMVSYVVAHEMGHQWWAHQVCGAEMQGSEMFSEGLAQYSALMVMEQLHGKAHVERFLKYELDRYLRGRASEREYENPLMLAEHQGYIHYQKAGIVFYYLKEMIGEDRVNSALQAVIQKYAYKTPFPNALQVMDELKAVTPDSMRYLITDLFETITLFNNRVDQVKVTPVGKQYRVDLTVHCEKLRCDSLGNEHPVALNDYIDVGIFGKPAAGDGLPEPILYNRQKITATTTELSFMVDHKPEQVGIDPYHYLIDKVISDNLKRTD